MTQGPGLVGALLVGISAAKALAWAKGLPLVPVDHLEGHVASLYLGPDPLEPPFTCLLASGGHTLLLAVREQGTVGAARDDARRRGGRGVRQGRPAPRPRVSRRGGDRPAGTRGDPDAFDFPVARVPGSRLLVLGPQDRAAVRDARPRPGRDGAAKADLAASYQRAIVRALVGRLRAAAESTGLSRVAVVGGVAANSELRAALPDARFVPLELCTDNAAMIASCARFVEPLLPPRYLALDAYASLT